MNQQFVEALKRSIGQEKVFEQEPMKRHTTFRVGGPADVLVRPAAGELPEVLALCRDHEIPYFIIGNGSNLLVGDKGIRGLVIEMTGDRELLTVTGNVLTVGAGVLLARAARKAAEEGLCGMEFAAGIPGSIGGAVVMNAGAYGGEMKDIIESVKVLTKDGDEKRLTREGLALGYRTSCIIPKRVEKQPLEYPSAGSTFKRPEGYFAGKLIMDAGLRGYQVGGAQVSEKHCGFVINRGDATAADICRLMEDVRENVQKQFGVTLEPEVKLVGEF